MNVNILLLPLVTLLLHTNPFSPSLLVYDVYKGSSLIGEMTVSRRAEGGKQIYTSTSQMTVTFLMSFDLRFTYESQFENNNLHSSMAANYRDGKQLNLSVGKREGVGYLTDVSGDKKRVNASRIDYSILNTYFLEPVGRNKVFSERWGEYVDFLPVGTNRYAMHLPNGDVNYMTYKNGICHTIEVNHSIASIKFVLREKQ